MEFPDRSVTEFTAAVRHKRESAARAQRDAEEATADAVRRLTSAGLSARDTGAVLGISHQRVAQLAPKGLKQAN